LLGFLVFTYRAFNPDGERWVSARHAVWFRNGGWPQVRHFCRESPHQLKIYAESNESDFSQIFGELISMQTLAIYRPLLVRGLLARDQAQRSRSVATKTKRDG
jgi:hypothetical protein